MNAIGLVCYEDQNFRLEPIELPHPGPRELRVRTIYSGISIGTEFALIENKISWGPFPIITGYLASGIFEAVGAEIDTFAPGDRVYYRNNTQNIKLQDGSKASAVSGLHCSHAITPVDGTHGADRLPNNLSLKVASHFVLPAVGYHGVDMSAPNIGDTVLVYGCGSIGLGVIAAAFLRGCRVIAVDQVENQLKLAREFGAEIIVNAGKEALADTLAIVAPEGADVVFECTGNPKLIDTALGLTRRGGKFVWQGNYGANPVNFSFLIPHEKQLHTYFPCDDGYAECRRAVLQHIAAGVLPWDKTISHSIHKDEAPDFFKKLLNRELKTTGAVVCWENPATAE